LRESVLPRLASFPFVKVWAAGCATGEEVYSLAVLLDEAGLLERCTIFGTDFNDDSLSRAKLGIYPLGRIQEFTRNYQETGATRPFADFYVASYDSATMVARLRERITFANHNLATDQVFGEMNLIFCRNVLIYFDRVLQDRALRLFADSLMRGGYLVLGTKEDLQFSSCAQVFEVVERGVKTFIKRGD
jgi:chemotaxis protein methyltransferase CheR